jgi:hypothetical protein
MALTTSPIKRVQKIGAKKATTWGTAVAVGTLSGLSTETLSGFGRDQDYIQVKEADAPLPRSSQLDVVKPVDFTHGVKMPYDPGALGSIVAALMGIAGAPAQQGGTTAYLHTLQLADEIYGLFFTIPATVGAGKVWECHSAKPMEWTLKAAERGFMASELKLRGDDIVDDSAVNGDSQMNALTYPNRENRILFRHNTVKVNDASAGDVGSATALNVNNIEVSIKRQGFDEPRGANSINILEPRDAGWPDIRVKLGFPRIDATSEAFFATAKAETYQKMIIVFTGALIASTYYYTLKFWFPKLRLLNPDMTYDEMIKLGIELIAEEASSAPTGMSYTRPYITLINCQTTDYLA